MAKFKDEEQRKRWNNYNNSYAREKYKSYNLKMNKETDKDVIDYIASSHESPTQIVKRLIRKEIGTGQ